MKNGGLSSLLFYNTLTTSLASSLYFLPLSLSFNLSFNPSLSSLALSHFLPVSPWRTPGLWRSRPSGRKQASPSLPLFFHNLLFMSDRPPPDKWLPYGERKAEEKEGRGGKTLSAFLFLSGLVSFSSGVSKFRAVFWRRFAGCVNISCCMASRLVPHEWQYVRLSCLLSHRVDGDINPVSL